MITLIAGSVALSLLHAVIPNHWLPILAIAKKEQWTLAQTTRVTLLAGLSHAISTVLIGVILGFAGSSMADAVQNFTTYMAPGLLVALGLFYVYQHYRHHHFHLHSHPEKEPHGKVIFSLAAAMFLSPCFEIEPYFLLAGAHGMLFVLGLGALYIMVTVTGMVMWVRLAFKGLLRLNWHAIEHNAGITTGIILLLSGLLSFFLG